VILDLEYQEMPRKMLMTWDGEKQRWRKQDKKLARELGLPESQRFFVTCFQLVEQGYLDASEPRTELATYRAANAWWQAQLAKIGISVPRTPHPLQDQLDALTTRLDYAKRHGLTEETKELSEEKERAEAITEPEATDLYMGEIVSEEASKNRKLLEELFGWKIPVDTPPILVEQFLGNDRVWGDRLSREAHSPVPRDRTIGGQVKSYLQSQAMKVKAGKLTAKRYDNLTYIFKIIESQLGSGRDVATITEQDIEKMHLYLLGKLAQRHKDPNGKAGYSEDYAKGILGRLRSFVHHLHVNRHIDDLPRNLGSFSIKVSEKPKQKMTDDEVLAILKGIPDDNQLKLHVLLMLNCGYRGMDIATLKESEIQDGRIIRKRHKTKDLKDTPTVNYKLWEETLRLLDRWRTGKDIALVTKSGGRWVYGDLIEGEDGSDKTKQTDSIATNFKRIVREGLGIDRPYSLLRKTAASKLDNHPEFGRYAEHYLGEKPDSVAKRHYITPSQDRFDAGLVWLGEQFGIK
jgi:integrase